MSDQNALDLSAVDEVVVDAQRPQEAIAVQRAKCKVVDVRDFELHVNEAIEEVAERLLPERIVQRPEVAAIQRVAGRHLRAVEAAVNVKQAAHVGVRRHFQRQRLGDQRRSSCCSAIPRWVRYQRVAKHVRRKSVQRVVVAYGTLDGVNSIVDGVCVPGNTAAIGQKE